TSDNSSIYVAGHNTLNNAPILEKLNRLGVQALDCQTNRVGLGSFSSRGQSIENNYQITPAPHIILPLVQIGAQFQPTTLSFNPEASCLPDCDFPEICDNNLDDDLDGFMDCADPDLIHTCCCKVPDTLDLGPDTILCNGGKVTLRSVRTFDDYCWSTGAKTDRLTVDAAGTYWLRVADSCGNVVTDTITLHLRPRPKLDLGPDTVLCSNAVIPLLAQEGFRTYEWIDGSTEKNFTAFDAGTYWVIATDSCGGVQADTVTIRIDPVTEINLGQDTSICPGDTLTFRLTGFTNYQWSSSSYIDCTDCPSVRFTPTEDTVLLVAADLGPGCVSSDSIRVRIRPTAGTRDSLTICPGDTIFFGQTPVHEVGQYFAERPNALCAITDTLDLFLYDTPVTLDTFFLCPGESMPVFGREESVAGIYQQRYTTAEGCDSLSIIQLILLAPDHGLLELPEASILRLGESVDLAPITNFTRSDLLDWRTSRGDSCIACPGLTLLPLETVEVSATGYYEEGCAIVARTTIQVLPDAPFYLPNAFSPNNDGVNDHFRLYPGPAVQELSSLRIYDRWGQEVFNTTNVAPTSAQAAWAGTLMSGQQAPMGVYVYVAEVRLIDGRLVRELGEVSLLR
ncbi:MAG: gliding motility-associated C-terminal domain-containing protein, partial [Bacteroidota bacterium]